MTTHTRITGNCLDFTSEEQARQVIEAVKAFREQTGMSQRELARNAGLPNTDIANFMQGVFAGDWRTTAWSLDSYLEQFSTGRVSSFVETRVSKEVCSAVNIAMESKSIGLIRGDTGMGKTTALRVKANETPWSVFVSVTTTNTKAKSLLGDISQQLRSYGVRCTTSEAYRWVEDNLRGRSILIIDEIHKLCHCPNDESFFILLDLYKNTGVPQLWSGTTDLIRYFNKRIGQGREPLAQIRRMIMPAVNLNALPGVEGKAFNGQEIQKMLSAGPRKLDTPALQYMVTLANLAQEGALGLVKSLYQMGCRIAAGYSALVITRDILREAHGHLGSQTTRAMVDARTPAEIGTMEQPAAAKRMVG